MSRSNAAAALLFRRKGDGSTLNLDFTTMGALDSRFTFTRSTTATYINSSGYVASAAINEARFEYHPTTLAAKGLLIEGSATNASLHSETFLTSGGVYNDNAILSRTTTEISPSGGTAVCFFPTIAVGFHRLQSASNPVLSGAVTISIWLKRKDSNYRGGINAGNYLGVSAVFDLNGAGSVVTLGGTATNKAATITAYANNWYRVSVTGTYITASSHFIFMTSSTSTDSTGQDFLGVASQGLIMWGAQLETGTGASTYIPTTTAQVTRNADFCKMTEAASQMSWLQKIDTCTFFVDFMPLTQRGAFNILMRFTTTTVQGYEFYVFDTTAGVSLTVTSKITASTNQEQTLAQNMNFNARHKVAYSIDATNGLRSHNGSTITAANPIALPTGTRSTFGIGSSGSDSGAMNGWIRAIKYYPTALTQAQINAMTT